jgi:hypothetical protein
MASFLDDNADLQYYLDKGVDWESLAAVTERGYGDPDGFKNGAEALTFYHEVAATMGKFAATEVAPFSAQLDRESFVLEDGELTIPPRLATIFEKLGDLGLHGMNVPRELWRQLDALVAPVWRMAAGGGRGCGVIGRRRFRRCRRGRRDGFGRARLPGPTTREHTRRHRDP